MMEVVRMRQLQFFNATPAFQYAKENLDFPATTVVVRHASSAIVTKRL
jgi:hypothetical protein